APFRNQMPHFDALWNVSNIFEQVQRSYRFYMRAAAVRLDHRPDIAHWTFPLPLRVPGAKNIYTMHDLVPLRLPYTTLHDKRRYLKTCRMLARTADHIVTVSECSKRDIVNLLGVPEEKITNTYQAV